MSARPRSPAAGAILGLAAGLMLPGAVAAQSGDRALGEYLSADCVTCHQISGRQTAGVPAIVGLPEDAFVALMNSYKRRERDNQMMQTMAARLSEEEIAALAAYFGSLRPQP
ncbi:c-type cytochrome [Phreatobacter sp.]|uniref:c-type cytochrome n=1 Tax=Phreatobacter sp. TaxID=1966341 RepID=UPI003F71094E